MRPTLEWHERLYYRDQLRAARYAALADSEGFHHICFALEGLGLRLHGQKEAMGAYKNLLAELARDSVVISELSIVRPELFTAFDALFELVKSARNDAMHSGVYARHATAAAIELCIGLEAALMKEQEMPRTTVKDFMVKAPVTVEAWQPVALARQLMLTHSFSFLPVQVDGKWKLISESSMARHLLRNRPVWKEVLAENIASAEVRGLELVDAPIVQLESEVEQLLGERENPVRLWLVIDENDKLCGVLSPFELM